MVLAVRDLGYLLEFVATLARVSLVGATVIAPGFDCCCGGP
jgi:hypothetical protein